MEVHEAQAEVREVFLGGFVGQLVSSAVWFVSAALGTWVAPRPAMFALFFGGACIFPVTQFVLRCMHRRASLRRDNPLNGLARQVALTVPLLFPLVGAATLYRTDWFYPAATIVVGAHYLPFAFLYGMWQFVPLAALLVAAGLTIGLYVHGTFALAGWFTAAVLLAFAFVARGVAMRRASDA